MERWELSALTITLPAFKPILGLGEGGAVREQTRDLWWKRDYCVRLCRSEQLKESEYKLHVTSQSGTIYFGGNGCVQGKSGFPPRNPTRQQTTTASSFNTNCRRTNDLPPHRERDREQDEPNPQALSTLWKTPSLTRRIHFAFVPPVPASTSPPPGRTRETAACAADCGVPPVIGPRVRVAPLPRPKQKKQRAGRLCRGGGI